MEIDLFPLIAMFSHLKKFPFAPLSIISQQINSNKHYLFSLTLGINDRFEHSYKTERCAKLDIKTGKYDCRKIYCCQHNNNGYFSRQSTKWNVYKSHHILFCWRIQAFNRVLKCANFGFATLSQKMCQRQNVQSCSLQRDGKGVFLFSSNILHRQFGLLLRIWVNINYEY